MLLTWRDIGAAIGTVGGVCGLWSLWYSRRQTILTQRQTVLMEQQVHRQESQDKEELDWSERFEHLATQLAQINPCLQIQPLGRSSAVALYASIFPAPKLREALETYIVQVNSSGTQFLRRNPRPDELRRTSLRETIMNAERSMADFQRNNPDIDMKYYMG